MKNLKKLSAIVLSTLFATMQISTAANYTTPINTGLGSNYGGAEVKSITGGYAGHNISGGTATFKFDANSHVNWNRLNLNKGETINFNAVSGKNGLTVLNTVNNGMSTFAGNINANSGIGKLIISNPNGVLFDGAKFTTAGDAMITTKNMTNVNVNNITDGTWGTFKDTATGDLVQVQILNNSDFGVGGNFTIVAPKIVGEASKITAGNLKLITANGADYTAQNATIKDTKAVTTLRAMNINGNVEIVNGIGALQITDGTSVDGDLKAEVGGYGVLYGADADNKIKITGDADLTGHGQQLILRNAEVNGNLTMTNDGGAVEINNVKADKDVNLTTTGWQPINHQKYNHYVHVNGDTHVGGDLTISSSQNIHIGNYKVTNDPYASNSTVNAWKGDLLPGKLTVDGDLKAEVTDGGHIMTTIDTSAKNIDFTAKSHKEGSKIYGGNILSDDKATLTAKTYKFKSDGYIGGLKATDGYTVDDKIVHMMEEYQFIPADTASHEYMNIAGGTISKIETPVKDANGNYVQTYIRSNGDLLVTGANAGDVNLVAPDKKITITGDDVIAHEFNIGGRTGTLQLDYPGRNFTTHYVNIKEGKVKTIKPDDEITYELTNAPDGYNSPDYKQTDGTKTTYLVGPKKDPVPPPKPKPTPTPPDDDNVRVKNWVPEDPTQPLVNTPVAFAADLDDEEEAGVRKNVDGSVTVIRAFPMMN